MASGGGSGIATSGGRLGANAAGDPSAGATAAGKLGSFVTTWTRCQRFDRSSKSWRRGSGKPPAPKPSSPICAQIPTKSRPSEFFSSLIVKARSKERDRFDRSEAIPFLLTAAFIAAAILYLTSESIRKAALLRAIE